MTTAKTDLRTPMEALAWRQAIQSVVKCCGIKTAQKVAEGAANWFMMKRLGRRAVAMLKPIA